MKNSLYNSKALSLLLFLLTCDNLFAFNEVVSMCQLQQRIDTAIARENQKEICKESSEKIAELLKSNNAYIYLKIPELGEEYLDYKYRDSDYDSGNGKRKERAIPINIEFNGHFLNPRKEDKTKYLVSSRIKERIISENNFITRRNCTFMALGSEYLFPVPAEEGVLSVILYFDYIKDLVYYSEFRSSKAWSGPEKYFDQFIHRGLTTEVNFKPEKFYQIEIKTNPTSALPRGSYNATTRNTFETMHTVPGFTITLKELPPNTKFAFDGKDDVGKTYEQVKKEFILYDHDAEKTKE